MSNWNPTLLQMPSWLGYTEERELPLHISAYAISQPRTDWWEVKIERTGEVVYSGIGPVQVVSAPVPF